MCQKQDYVDGQVMLIRLDIYQRAYNILRWLMAIVMFAWAVSLTSQAMGLGWLANQRLIESMRSLAPISVWAGLMFSASMIKVSSIVLKAYGATLVANGMFVFIYSGLAASMFLSSSPTGVIIYSACTVVSAFLFRVAWTLHKGIPTDG